MNTFKDTEKIKEETQWGFPGGPVVKTLASKAGSWSGVAVPSLVIELNSHMPRSQKTKT